MACIYIDMTLWIIVNAAGVSSDTLGNELHGGLSVSTWPHVWRQLHHVGSVQLIIVPLLKEAIQYAVEGQRIKYKDVGGSMHD